MRSIFIALCVWLVIVKANGDQRVISTDANAFTYSNGASRDTNQVISIRSGHPNEITSATSTDTFTTTKLIDNIQFQYRYSCGYTQTSQGATARLILENTQGNELWTGDINNGVTLDDDNYWWHKVKPDGSEPNYSPIKIETYDNLQLVTAPQSVRFRIEFTNNGRNVHFLQSDLSIVVTFTASCGDGGIAVVEGDPHYINWVGARHHFQGQPTIGGKEQYYYMYPCNGYDEDDMPIYMMGRHVKWGNRAVSGLDYVTLRIFDGNNEYLLFLSSAIRAYKLRSGSNDNYLYDSYAAGELTTIANDGNPHSIGASSFTVNITDKPQSGKPGVKIAISWGSCSLDIEMFGQNSYNNGRYQMNKMVILPPECLKCYTCGLLGSFPETRRRLSAANVIQTCDGSDYEYPSGFRGESGIYDADGWSWEVGRVDAGCQAPDNAIYEPAVDGTIDTNPCAQSIADSVKIACAQARTNMAICCDQIPAGMCDAVQTSCEIDACVAAAGDETQISSNVDTSFTEVIEAICSVENIENIGPNDDINECVENPTICGNSAQCSNTIGSYQCICDPGYVKDGSTCVDIDECSNNPCGTNGACVNEPGSYTCNCNGGYVFDGDACIDYDECINDACNGNGECINNDGSFECDCNGGYVFNGVTCVDIDECIGYPCGEYGECQNTVGSYVCNCVNGYTFDGITCVDYDECIDDPCDGNGECINIEGTYECKYCITCNPGNSCVTPFESANVNIFQTGLVEWIIRGVLLLIIIGLICYIRCYSIGGKTEYYQSVKAIDTDSEFVSDENQKLNV